MSEHLDSASKNLSVAWAQLFLHLMKRGVAEASPAITTITDIVDETEQEHASIRSALDRHVDQLRPKYAKLHSCHTVANTIFPISLWNPRLENDADVLYRRFQMTWPRIKQCSANRKGSYFQRLVAFQGDQDQPSVNQLAHIAETYRAGNHRRSALQAGVFDPRADHNHARVSGFPCLHQVAFTPVNQKELHLTAFYGTQYVVDRAYGNYLGLCRLGRFMAKQMGLRFTQMTCIASVALLGTPGKTELQPLANELEALLEQRNETPK